MSGAEIERRQRRDAARCPCSNGPEWHSYGYHDDDAGPLQPAYRQTVHGIEPIPERFREAERIRAVWGQGGPLDTAGKVEWLMAGMDRSPAGKRLYASRDLSETDFRLAVDQHQNGQGWRVSSVLSHMLIIDRPTYGECLAEMARIWANWDAGGRREITT